MASVVEARALIFRREHRAFVLRKLHSLTGVVPVGVFLVLHLWTVAHAMQGQDAFEQALSESRGIPNLLFFELVFVFLPLLFHALYGLKLAAEGRATVRSYPSSGNWGYLTQRVTGVIILAFVCFHLYELRARTLFGGLTANELFPELCASLSSTTGPGVPLRALAYLFALAASAFHLSYGLYGFCFSWGITRSRRASNGASLLFGLFGLALFVLGATTVLYFATGSRLTLSLEGYAVERSSITCRHFDGTDREPTPSAADRSQAPGQPGPASVRQP